MFDDILNEPVERFDPIDLLWEARSEIQQLREEVKDLLYSITDFIKANPDRDYKKDFPNIAEDLEECLEYLKEKEDGDD